MASIKDIRRDYVQGRLDADSLNPDPFSQFNAWLDDAIAAGLPDPTAMTVATVDGQGQPSQRIVLLKHLDENGFVFYTNLESRKATELEANPKISLHFPWHPLERQVKVCGVAKQVSIAEATAYFLSRPKGSQLAAWTSQQSRPISTRQMLMQKFEETKQRFASGNISLPKFWGGFRIVPHEIEFWQGGEHRLHDRFQYSKQEDGSWSIQRLMP